LEEVTAGLDIGTSSIKIVFFDKTNVVYCDKKDHAEIYYEGKEINPEKLLENIFLLLKKAVKQNPKFKIKAIGLSTFFPSLIVVDKNGKPLTSIITWLDNRGEDIINKFSKKTKIAFHKKTGCVIHPSHNIWKILWLRENRKDIFLKANKFLSLSDYLVLRPYALLR